MKEYKGDDLLLVSYNYFRSETMLDSIVVSYDRMHICFSYPDNWFKMILD